MPKKARLKRSDRPLEEIMTPREIEESFLPGLAEVSSQFLLLLAFWLPSRKKFERDFFFNLGKESDYIESFLDDFGARNNKRFVYYGQLVASTRWLAQTLFQYHHIRTRFDYYRIPLSKEERKAFLESSAKKLSYFSRMMRLIGQEILEESHNIGIMPNKKPRAISSMTKTLPLRKILPSDLDQKVITEKEERMVDLMMKFLEVRESFLLFYAEIKEKKREASEKLTEETIESFRSSIHRLQSLYDTYLKNSDAEKEHPELVTLRGSISISLHLCEIGKFLLHFYERHAEKITAFAVDRPRLRKISFTRIVEYVHHILFIDAKTFFDTGRALSEQMFISLESDPDEYLLETVRLTIPHYHLEDFHLRPIMPVTRIAEKYRIASFLYYNRKKYEIKSPLDMAMAIPDIREALSRGTVSIILQGSKKAVTEMKSFFNERCGAMETKSAE
ncbi:MAG: hypothetical protein WDA18_00095 [Candidatus Ratteibacteria bacterium]